MQACGVHVTMYRNSSRLAMLHYMQLYIVTKLASVRVLEMDGWAKGKFLF